MFRLLDLFFGFPEYFRPECIKELRGFILDTKYEQVINNQEFKFRIKYFVTHGRQLIREYKYANELSEFLDSAEQLMENIRNDEFVRVLRHHAGLVAADLTYTDSEGRVQIDTEILGKLRTVIVPLLAESFKYIPIPRIQYSDEKREYWVDNIVLCGYDVIPDNVLFQIETDNEISIRDIEMKSNTRLLITIKKIRTELKNLDFYYKRKSFFELAESGRVTLRFTGDGATLTTIFHVQQDLDDKFPKFMNGEAHFDIHKLEIQFDKRTLNHEVLVPIVTSMFNQNIKNRIEVEVEKKLTELMEIVGDKLTMAISQINRPFMTGIDSMRKVIKASDVGQVYERRREKLE